MAEAIALGGSEGHPSHIYYQLFFSAKHIVFEKRFQNSHLWNLPFLKWHFHLIRLEEQWDIHESVGLS